MISDVICEAIHNIFEYLDNYPHYYKLHLPIIGDAIAAMRLALAQLDAAP